MLQLCSHFRTWYVIPVMLSILALCAAAAISTADGHDWGPPSQSFRLKPSADPNKSTTQLLNGCRYGTRKTKYRNHFQYVHSALNYYSASKANHLGPSVGQPRRLPRTIYTLYWIPIGSSTGVVSLDLYHLVARNGTHGPYSDVILRVWCALAPPG